MSFHHVHYRAQFVPLFETFKKFATPRQGEQNTRKTSQILKLRANIAYNQSKAKQRSDNIVKVVTLDERPCPLAACGGKPSVLLPEEPMKSFTL